MPRSKALNRRSATKLSLLPFLLNLGWNAKDGSLALAFSAADAGMNRPKRGSAAAAASGYKMDPKTGSKKVNEDLAPAPLPTVAYRTEFVPMPEFDVMVPMALWYPTGPATKKRNAASSSQPPRTASAERLIMDFPDPIASPAKARASGTDGATPSTASLPFPDGTTMVPWTKKAIYPHRISVRKIGQFLAGWDFIPEFVSKDFPLTPSMNSERRTASTDGVWRELVVDGEDIPLPDVGPVVFLAHGFLGSRFDLSHIAEELARQGFICVSPEYPDSLAASYPMIDGLDRDEVITQIHSYIQTYLGIHATSYGIIGHSMGCRHAMTLGDDGWARVCIAGFATPRDGSTVPGSVLFLSSVNDGILSVNRLRDTIPPEYVQLDENDLVSSRSSAFPRKSALIFDRPDAPNHISFLAGSVNDAMIDFLSPLLPVAQAMKIPVLDFDKYSLSRDSLQTAEIVVPIITSYLRQQML